MSHISRRHRLGSLIAVVTALLLTVAACSTADNDAVSNVGVSDADAERAAVGEPAAPEEPATDEVATEGEGLLMRAAGELGTGGVQPVVPPANLGRDIIFTADLTVAVNNVASAGAEATQVIESLGGFVFGQQTTGAPEPRSVLTFKIAPDAFQEALARLGDIGDVRTQNVTADDVTEIVVDLQSRIDTAETSVERLRSFLDNADDVATIARLERELLQRETQLESLRGQLRTLRDRVDLATIVVTLTEKLTEPRLRVTATAYPGHDDGTSCPGQAELALDEGAAATFCLEIENRGDTGLTQFELREPVLDLDIDDMTVVFGDLDAVLEPGQSLVLAADIAVDRTTRPQARVSATAVDEEGTPVTSRTVSSTATSFIEAVDPGGPPSFTDGLSGAANLLATLGMLLVFAVGVALPFLPLLLAAGALWWWWRRRHTRPSVPPAPPEDEEPAKEPVGAGV